MSSDTIIDQNQMAALLGRPLSQIETTNYTFYLDIAVLRLSDLLCLTPEEMKALPSDFLLLLARCFGVIQAEQEQSANLGVSNKKVEDFSISYAADAATPMEAFVQQNGSLLAKYDACQGSIRSGEVCCGHCI